MPSSQPRSSGHYFTASPDSDSSPIELELALPEGRLITLTSDKGVFSGDRVDPGTRVLLSEGPPVDGPVLADVGCGYGPIAVALALRAPEATIWAVDVNERARELCASNALANGVADRVKVIAPTEVPDDLVVDQIWSNPPIRIGKQALHELLRGWLDRLRPGTGSAELVVQKHLGSDSLAQWLNSQGWPTERVVSRAGYRVLHVSAPDDDRDLT